MLGIPRSGLPWNKPAVIANLYSSKLALWKKRRPTHLSCFPVSAYIEPTVVCDIDCTFCHSRELRTSRKRVSMTYAEFERVLDEIPTLINITLQGMGEPTLNKDFFRMVRCARDRGIMVRTITNCNRHTPEITSQLLGSGLWFVGTSIDGAVAETHESGRRGGDFKRTVENLTRLARDRGSATVPVISVEMLCFDYNFTEIPDWVKMCADAGADELVIKARIGSWGKKTWVAKTLAHASAFAEKDKQEIYIERAMAVASERGIKAEVLRSPFFDNENKCPKPWDDVYICSTGDVVPCCAISDPRVKCMGNIFEESFRSIWNNSDYVALRETLLSGTIPEHCLACYAPEQALEDATGDSTSVRLPVLK